LADAEVQIIIRAIDEISATMKKIEKDIGYSNKQIQKTADATSNSFTEQTGNLLVLGQATQSVENIFGSYGNMQMRLENVTERNTAAHERLEDAQANLVKVQKDASSTADDLAKAQNEVERATRGVTISDNALSKAQGDVLKTYISMSIQAITLVASLGKVITAIKAMTTASLAFMATPLGLILAAIAAAVALGTMAWNAHKKALEDVKKAEEDLIAKREELVLSEQRFQEALEAVEVALKDYGKSLKDIQKAEQQRDDAHAAYVKKMNEKIELERKLSDSADNYAEAIKEAYGIMSGVVTAKSQEEIRALIEIEKQRHDVNKAKLSGDEEEIASEQAKLEEMQKKYQVDYEDKRALAQLEIQLIKEKTNEKYGVEQESARQTEDLFRTSYGRIDEYLRNEFYPIIEEQLKISKEKEQAKYTEVANEAVRLLGAEEDAQQKVTDAISASVEKNTILVSKLKELQTAYNGIATSINGVKTAQDNLDKATEKSSWWKRIGQYFKDVFTGNYGNSEFNPNSKNYSGKGGTYNDFMVTPQGKIMNISPDDYILGTKNPSTLGGGGGPSYQINITGNIYGTDPRAIGIAIQRELANKINY